MGEASGGLWQHLASEHQSEVTIVVRCIELQVFK